MSVGIWAVGEGQPRRAVRSKVDLEASLEDWIAADPALLSEGLRVVGQQVSLEAGRLDLLAIDAQDRWIVIELKKGRLHREAVAQALDYAACIRRIPAEELSAKLAPNFASFGDPDDLGQQVHELLQSEDGEREVAVALVGTGIDPGLERVVEYLADYQLPVSVVTFEVFAMDSGKQLLVREVIEEQVDAPTGTPKTKSLEDIQRQADRYGVGEAFERLVAASEVAGLFVRPYVRSVMVAPPSHKNRFLMAMRPNPDGRLRIEFGPDAFGEFFEDVSPQDVLEALGPATMLNLSGQQLEDFAAAAIAFLQELPTPFERDADGPTADAETVMAIAELVRPGEWTTYGDISTVAIGRASAAMAVGTIARTRDEFPNAHRLLTRHGTVPEGWSDGGGGGPEVCRQRLIDEGVLFDSDGRADRGHRVPVEMLEERLRQRIDTA